MRVLVVYYSQTGDSAAVARAIAEPFESPPDTVRLERLQPAEEYPYPWRSLLRFFSVLPECLLGPPPGIQPLSPDVADARFDLVVLVYQVWFLSPSLPVQGLLASESARVLRNAPVVTVSVSRNMWLSASERMKDLLLKVGANHAGNMAVTHQGPPWATFVTAPRSLLWGRKDPFWGVFPPAGLAPAELDRVRRLGALLRERCSRPTNDVPASLLEGTDAVAVNRRYLIPECVGWYLFVAWAHLLKGLGRLGRLPRQLGVACFIVFLVAAVVVGIPLLSMGTLLVWPLLRRPVAAYVRRLSTPAGRSPAAAPPEVQTRISEGHSPLETERPS
uniref:Dialkylresorcinol condensing enzyme n=1 Tax=Schlesneria paludicola TaxID=360056 RepID=A0A7C2NVP2_9PLAN